MARQSWVELISCATASGTAVANSTTETIIFPNITIPANYMQDGRLLRLRMQGELSTTGTPTMIFRLRWGGVSGTVIGLTPTFTCGNNSSKVCWDVDAIIQVRSNGSAGTVVVIGLATVNGATVPSQSFCVAGAATPAATACDFIADTALSATAIWSAQSASNTLTGWNYTLESLN